MSEKERNDVDLKDRLGLFQKAPKPAGQSTASQLEESAALATPKPKKAEKTIAKKEEEMELIGKTALLEWEDEEERRIVTLGWKYDREKLPLYKFIKHAVIKQAKKNIEIRAKLDEMTKDLEE